MSGSRLKLPPAALRLATAFVDASALRALVREGLGALKDGDIQLIALELRTSVRDSLDLDAAAREQHPNANRWDYLVALRDRHEIVGVEPHSARDDQISVVIAKKREAMNYLSIHFRAGVAVSRWYWITRGQVGFSKMDRARRSLDQNGITFRGRALRDFN